MSGAELILGELAVVVGVGLLHALPAGLGDLVFGEGAVVVLVLGSEAGGGITLFASGAEVAVSGRLIGGA